jgi:hypothetical protein
MARNEEQSRRCSLMQRLAEVWTERMGTRLLISRARKAGAQSIALKSVKAIRNSPAAGAAANFECANAATNPGGVRPSLYKERMQSIGCHSAKGDVHRHSVLNAVEDVNARG